MEVNFKNQIEDVKFKGLNSIKLNIELKVG
jgi:hypothetical protein